MGTPNNREVVMREIITMAVWQLNKWDGFLLSNIFYTFGKPTKLL